MLTTIRKPFNQRAFVTLVAAVAGAGLPLTGFANHVLQTDPINPSRHAWMAAHNGLGIIFATFAIWHAILNRRALVSHLRGAMGRWRMVGREALWAVALVTVALSVAVGHTFHGP
jgi:hypothetical protein